MLPLQIIKASLRLLFLFSLLCFRPAQAQLGIGFKTSLMQPYSDLGPVFKKNASFELYLVREYDNGTRSRLGFFYAGLRPRMDTFPVYMVRHDNTPTVLPGYEAYGKCYMAGIFLEHHFRLFRYKGFTLTAGGGMLFGIADIRYSRAYETVLTESGSHIQQEIGGLSAGLSAFYEINPRMDACIQGMRNFMTATDWSSGYTHNTYGIGIHYYFQSRTEE